MKKIIFTVLALLSTLVLISCDNPVVEDTVINEV